MNFNDIEKKKIEKELKAFLEKRRPPIEIRNRLDINYRIENQSVIIFEIRPVWNNPEEKREIPVAKTTFVKTSNTWKIYWQRADLKWHVYKPQSEVKSINEFVSIVDKDENSCFWG